MIEFFLILVAAGVAVSSNSFWRLLVGTLVMLIGGYAGESGITSPILGFIIGMIGLLGIGPYHLTWIGVGIILWTGVEKYFFSNYDNRIE